MGTVFFPVIAVNSVIRDYPRWKLTLSKSLEQVSVLEVGLLQSTLQERHLLILFLEWIITTHPEIQQIPQADIIPIQIVRDALLTRQFDQFSPKLSASVLRWMGGG